MQGVKKLTEYNNLNEIFFSSTSLIYNGNDNYNVVNKLFNWGKSNSNYVQDNMNELTGNIVKPIDAINTIGRMYF